MSETFPEPNAFTKSLFEKLVSHPKRIVFPEGEDLRILRVAAEMVRREIGVPILLGKVKRMRKLAADNSIDLTFVRMIDPKESSDLKLFCGYYEKSENARGIRVAMVEQTVSKPQNFGAMMVQYGHADGMVSGNKVLPAVTYRAVLHMIKPLADVPKVFSTTLLVAPHLDHFGHEGFMLLADTGVIPDPESYDLASIAVETGKLAHHLLGRKPRVCMLSHSTKGSTNTPGAQRVRAATALAQKMVKDQGLTVRVDGELQADVALDAESAEIKLESEKKIHAPDVMVFPNLDAAHISMKLLQHVGGAQNYGSLIMGCSKPTAQVPRTASIETILGTAALVGVEAIKFNQLHLDDAL